MNNKMKENATTILIIMTIVMFIIGSFFLYKGYDVKSNYRNLEYSLENAYVGGDAYNYIINGTYFTAYSVIGAGSYISASIFFTGFLLIMNIKETEQTMKKAEELPQI